MLKALEIKSKQIFNFCKACHCAKRKTLYILDFIFLNLKVDIQMFSLLFFILGKQ